MVFRKKVTMEKEGKEEQEQINIDQVKELKYLKHILNSSMLDKR